MTDYQALAQKLAFGQPGGGTQALGIMQPGIMARSGYSKSMNDWALNRMRRSAEQKKRIGEYEQEAFENENEAGILDFLGLGIGGASAIKGFSDRKRMMKKLEDLEVQ